MGVCTNVILLDVSMDVYFNTHMLYTRGKKDERKHLSNVIHPIREEKLSGFMLIFIRSLLLFMCPPVFYQPNCIWKPESTLQPLRSRWRQEEKHVITYMIMKQGKDKYKFALCCINALFSINWI